MKYVTVMLLTLVMVLEMILRFAFIIILVCTFVGILLFIDNAEDIFELQTTKLIKEVLKS